MLINYFDKSIVNIMKNYDQYIEEISNDCDVDIHDLGKAVLIQPSLFLKWSTRAANAVHEKKMLKTRLNVIKAELELAVRRNPPKDLGKLTEGSITALVTIDPKYIEAEEEYIEAETFASDMLNAKQAMEEKRDALKNAKDLYATGYWATKPVPDMQGVEAAYVDKKTSETLTKKLKRRRDAKQGGD